MSHGRCSDETDARHSAGAGCRRNTTGEMMQLSYAQNMEDYHLDLIFAGQATGACMSTLGRAIRWPTTFLPFLPQGLARSGGGAAGGAGRTLCPRSPARRDGPVLPGRQGRGRGRFSPGREAARVLFDGARACAGAAQFGASYQTICKRVRPLAALIDEAGLAAIDFLKIDVEGAEAEVLAGMDLARHRPRLLLIEAVQPGSMAEASGRVGAGSAGARAIGLPFSIG